MIFGIQHNARDMAEKELLLNKINRGLKDNSLKKMFVNGYLRKFGNTTLFKIEPLINFNPFWIGVIWFVIFIILNIQSSLIYLGLLPILIGFAWTKYFWFMLIIKSFKKYKIKGKIKLLTDEELINFLESKIEWMK